MLRGCLFPQWLSASWREDWRNQLPLKSRETRNGETNDAGPVRGQDPEGASGGHWVLGLTERLKKLESHVSGDQNCKGLCLLGESNWSFLLPPFFCLSIDLTQSIGAAQTQSASPSVHGSCLRFSGSAFSEEPRNGLSQFPRYL